MREKAIVKGFKEGKVVRHSSFLLRIRIAERQCTKTDCGVEMGLMSRMETRRRHTLAQ